MYSSKKLRFFLSLLLSAFVIAASLIAISDAEFYAAETENWRLQAIVQDWVDLCLIIPFFLLATILNDRDNRFAKAAWLGILFYLTYTFTIYCFDVHFNKLFLLYCAVFSLSFYLSLLGVLDFLQMPARGFQKSNALNATAWYFIFIALVFCALWLSEILPAIWNGIVPSTIVVAGLPTNAVHVLDLSLFLPALAITGVLLLKQKQIAFLIAPCFLVFFIVMDITISALTYYMYWKGLDGSLSIAFVMIALAMISIFFLVWFLKAEAHKTTNEIITKSSIGRPSLINS